MRIKGRIGAAASIREKKWTNGVKGSRKFSSLSKFREPSNSPITSSPKRSASAGTKTATRMRFQIGRNENNYINPTTTIIIINKSAITHIFKVTLMIVNLEQFITVFRERESVGISRGYNNKRNQIIQCNKKKYFFFIFTIKNLWNFENYAVRSLMWCICLLHLMYKNTSLTARNWQ